MHDIRFIRENPDAFDSALAARGADPVAARILDMDERRRAVATRMQEAQKRRNEASKAIGQAMGKGDTAAAEALKADVARIKQELPDLEAQDRELSEGIVDILSSLPNLPADDVPPGKDEADNVFVREWGEKPSFDFEPRPHDELAQALGLDMPASGEIAGARFAVMHLQLARLQRIIGQFMLETQSIEHGFHETYVPLLVRDEAMFGTGQLPKFEDDSFRTTDGRWLIPTAEVSLTNIVAGRMLEAAHLPLRMSALTPCFRSEAGAAGKDTKGLIRQHQFEKVELVAITAPEDSATWHETMLMHAETILQKLNIHYRVMLLCAGDMGFSARKTYDIEVWLPGQNAYREISSISNCGDFQARRMNARYRPEEGAKPDYVHTLNGSGLAVGRTLVAVLENYQEADGAVRIPEVLLPYAKGTDTLRPRAGDGSAVPPLPGLKSQ